MKPDDRLTRKSHSRRAVRADQAADMVRVYDLTQADNALGEPHFMSDIMLPACLDETSAHDLPQHFQKSTDILAWLATALADSPTASRLWIEAESAGWQVSMADLKNGGFYIDLEERVLILDDYGLEPEALGRSPYFRSEVLICFVRALRDIWHEQRYGSLADEFAPESALMLERVRAADCDTIATLVGWELRGAGYADIWRHLIGSEEGDMALVFTRFLERDPTAFFDGSALAYAFRQWYADEARIDGCDHETLESLDDVLLAHQGSHRPFGERRMSATDIEELALLPDGRSYLQGLGDMILRDPFFAGLHDPVNQTHLFHLMYDIEVVMVNDVPFRDAKLARRIFPGAFHERVR